MRADYDFSKSKLNEALRRYLSETDQPVTEKVLRHVLREEIPEYLKGMTRRSTPTRR